MMLVSNLNTAYVTKKMFQIYKNVPLYDSRDMRHRDLSQDHMGKLSQCKICKTKISSINNIEKYINTIFLSSSSDADSNNIMTINDMAEEKSSLGVLDMYMILMGFKKIHMSYKFIENRN